MQRLEVSGAVRPIYGSLGVRGLIRPAYGQVVDSCEHRTELLVSIIRGIY